MLDPGSQEMHSPRGVRGRAGCGLMARSHQHRVPGSHGSSRREAAPISARPASFQSIPALGGVSCRASPTGPARGVRKGSRASGGGEHMGGGEGVPPCPSRKLVMVQRTGILELRREIPKQGGAQRGRSPVRPGIGHRAEGRGAVHCKLCGFFDF